MPDVELAKKTLVKYMFYFNCISIMIVYFYFNKGIVILLFMANLLFLLLLKGFTNRAYEIEAR